MNHVEITNVATFGICSAFINNDLLENVDNNTHRTPNQTTSKQRLNKSLSRVN